MKQLLARNLDFNQFLSIIGETFQVPNVASVDVDTSATTIDMPFGEIRALVTSRKRNIRTWFLDDKLAKSIRLDTHLQHEAVKLPIKNGK